MKKKLGSILLGAALVCASLALFAACGGGHTEHVFVEDESGYVAPTCTEDGKKLLRCSICNETQEETIPALGHDWDEGVVTREPTCTTPGVRELHCTRGDAMEPQPIDPVEHTWTVESVTREPTCGTAGDGIVRCSVCQKTEEGVGVIPATGKHTFEDFFTLDEKPTFEQEGSRSRHCSVCGAKTGVVTIEKLDAETEFPYEFHLVRADGGILPANDFRYSVQLNGEEVARGSFKSGVTDKPVPLKPAAYTLKITQMPDGYTAREVTTDFDTFTQTGRLLAEIPVSAALLETPAAEDTVYALNAVMHDFTFTDVLTGTQHSLKALLAEKKGVFLNFFYVDCQFCNLEFPQVKRLYAKYKDDVEFISINASKLLFAGSPDTDDAVKGLAAKHQLSHMFVGADEGYALSKAFSIKDPDSGVPFNAFIDCDGVVRTIHSGYVGYNQSTGEDNGSNEAVLERAILGLIGYADSVRTPAPAALPPVKRRGA